MTRPISVGAIEVRPGDLRAVDVEGRRVAIANVDGTLYAFDDACTHEQCSLADEGVLEGNVVTCGCHGAQFDVTTGNVLAPPAPQPVGTYPIHVRGGQVIIEA